MLLENRSQISGGRFVLGFALNPHTTEEIGIGIFEEAIFGLHRFGKDVNRLLWYTRFKEEKSKSGKEKNFSVPLLKW